MKMLLLLMMKCGWWVGSDEVEERQGIITKITKISVGLENQIELV
jgi:hypothetical protein